MRRHFTVEVGRAEVCDIAPCTADPARIVRSARVPTGPAPRDTFRPPPPLAQGDVGCVEQGSWAKSTVRNGPSATQATPYALACFASRPCGTCGAQAAVEAAAAIAAELEFLLGLGDGCIGRRVTDRKNIMTFACNYA
jgi:hypothetical protein